MEKFKTGVILAGGKSSRMKFDKQFLQINEKRLMNHMIEMLKKEFEEIIIVTNKPAYYDDFPYKIISDEIKEKGPLSGIHVALKESKSEYVYFTACDMPNVNINYIRYMKEKLKNIQVSACVTRLGEWIEPFHAFYNKNMIKDIEEYMMQDKKSIYILLEKVKTLYIEEKIAKNFSPNWDMFLNLNTKQDLIKYMNKIK